MSVEYVGSGDAGVGDDGICVDGFTYTDHKKVKREKKGLCECAREGESIADTMEGCEKERVANNSVDLDTDSEVESDAELDVRDINQGSNAARGMRATTADRRAWDIEARHDKMIERLQKVKILPHGKGTGIFAKKPDGTVSAASGNLRKVYPAKPVKTRPSDGYYSTTSEEGDDSDDDYP